MNNEDLVKKLIKQQMLLMKFADYLDYKEVEWFEECKCDLADLILELMETPEDNTVEMEKKYGDKWHEAKECFCRDQFEEILYEYEKDVNIVYRKLIDLKNNE